MNKEINKVAPFKLWCSVTKAIVILAYIVLCAYAPKTVSGKERSKSEVELGVITYSFRSMLDQSLPAILNYVVRSGLHSVELMGGPVEQYAGIPKVDDPQLIRQWRVSVSIDKFKSIRKMFDAKGVKIDILKLGDKSWSNEEIDYAFHVCKILGAKGLSMEISEETAKRMAPFAERHNRYVIFHNHGQPGDPNFSFDKILAIGPKLMLNFDAGHYFGATGLNPCILIERLHNRIVSIHIKDKTGPNASDPNKNQQFGRGETPVIEMLQLIKKNKWPIACDIELEYTIPAGSDAVKEVAKCAAYCQSALLIKK